LSGEVGGALRMSMRSKLILKNCLFERIKAITGGVIELSGISILIDIGSKY